LLEYEINEKTLALIPVDEAKTKIYEVDKNFIVNKPIMKIMEESCQYFGSSLSGRQKGTTNLIGVTHKSPIIVEESKEMIFFPTASPRRNKCSWISLKNIDSYYTKEAFSYIKFNNNLELKLNISYGIIDNQILRATRLESVLRKRKY